VRTARSSLHKQDRLAQHGLPTTTDTTKPKPLALPGPEPGQAGAPRATALARTARTSLRKQVR